jgi:hypothetical protein
MPFHLLPPWFWWVASSILSNVCIIATEYYNRAAVGGWETALPKTAPLILIAQFCLFYSFNTAPHWLVAWMVFTVGNSIMRVGAVRFFFAGEVASWVTVCLGAATMLVGALVLKRGLA